MSNFTTLMDSNKHQDDAGLDAILYELAAGNADRDFAAKDITASSVSTDAITYTDTYWKDHLISLVGVNPVGPATDPTADNDGEGWLFAASAINVAVLGTQINHDCEQGAGVVIKPHLHWRKTSDADGDVTWRLEYKVATPGASFGAYAQLGSDVSNPITGTVDNDTAARHLITSFGDLELTVGLSTMVYFKLSRVGDATADTYGGNALAMSFDFHYPVDTPCSAGEYTK